MSVNRAQRVDLEVVTDLIPPHSRVLDVGSG
ncbi:MAG: methionine biosynthesis protein MetW, partial [Mesorhizobium sp.]